MSKRNIREKIKIMKAFSEGKPIQKTVTIIKSASFIHGVPVGDIQTEAIWIDDAEPTWNWENNDYRIKLESD